MGVMGDDVTRMGSKELCIVRDERRRFLATYRRTSIVLGELQNVISNTFVKCWRRLMESGSR
jgi:hypothetical protein